jgi:alkylation response protein AidB-like acyl-CoA dehydrogenase
MDLKYTPEDIAFREHVRAWIRENPPPADLTTLEQKKAWHRRLYDAGFVGMGWPKEYGGRESRPMEQAIVSEELARAKVPGPINGLGIGLLGPTLIVHGTEAQKQRYVRKILTAEEIWCQLYSEPNAGSDLAALRTVAERQGDEYIVNGQKVWTSSGRIADFGMLLARTNRDVPKHAGISYFILDMHAPGVDVQPLKQITGSSEFCQIFFTNVRVPAENIIGKEGEGWRLAQTTLGFERGGNTLSRATRHEAQLDRLIEICQEQPRRNRKAIDDPLIRQKLGRMLVEGEVLRYGGLRILSKLETGQRPGAEASVDKLYYSELDKYHQELMQEVLGPYGQLADGLPTGMALDDGEEERVPDDPTQTIGWTYNFLWARAGTIYAGSSEIQKNIIGERVLNLPRELRMDRLPAPVQDVIVKQEKARAQRGGGEGAV